MISGLVLKYLNEECFVIRRGYETTRPLQPGLIWQCTVKLNQVEVGGWSRSLSVWQNTPHLGTLKRALRSSAWLWCFMFNLKFNYSLLVPKSQLNPTKCVCASVAHVLSVTLSQRKSTKEVYRKLMRNMRTDAIVNQWSTTATTIVPLVSFCWNQR